MKILLGALALSVSSLAACSSGTSPGATDAGAAVDAGEGGASGETALTAAAAASPYLAKCKVACRPPAGTCAAEDTNACINDCTGVVEGLAVRCAQCITEHSGWSGTTCGSTGTLCHFSRSGPPLCRKACVECDAGPECTAAAETCDGYSFAKSSFECQVECQ